MCDFRAKCTTGRSQDCNPVTPLKYILLSNRTHPDVLGFITHIYYASNKLLMNLCDTRHLMERDTVTMRRVLLLLCCCECNSTQYHDHCSRSEYVLWRHTMRYDYSLEWLNRSRDSPLSYLHSSLLKLCVGVCGCDDGCKYLTEANKSLRPSDAYMRQ